MKKVSMVLVFGVVVLFFIQSAGTLVESIYILDLMNTTLDEKALGILFFFAPVLLIPLYRKFPRGLMWISFALLFAARGMLPYLNTASRMLASGFGVFTTIGLCFLLLRARPQGEVQAQIGSLGSAGLGLAVSLSVLLRTVNFGIDYSLIPAGGWVGWGLSLLLGWLLTQLEFGNETPPPEKKTVGVTSAVVGIILILTLIWFAFSAPAVIARWTEGDYFLIVTIVSFFSVGFVLVTLAQPQLLEKINRRGLLLWNILFAFSLTATILAHRVAFPPTPDSAPVVVTSPSLLAQMPLVLMLFLFPVIFIDMRLFLSQIQQTDPAPLQLVPGMLLGSLILVLLVFAHIFTNVWGYVEPVSTPFRGQFWLPYCVLAGLITLLTSRKGNTEALPEQESTFTLRWEWALLLLAIFLVTAIWALPRNRIQETSSAKTSLLVMTYNIQQANDDSGERSFDRQLALMRKVSPDIISLQESDSTRISINNNDYVRYFAEKLGYYSYYGPTTVTGTYGTAILSRFPLLNTRTAFSYSDTDEIGIAEAEIEVNGRRFTIYDVHPDGSNAAMLAFAKTLLERSTDKPNVIALGDYNLRDYEEAYQMIDAVYTNAWVSVYPSKVGAGVDMSGKNRIDHIFVSPDLQVRNATYVLPPESATDHPVHWAEIYWQNP